VSPRSGLGPGGGFNLLNATFPWVLTFNHVGALISGAWYGAVNPIGNFIVIEEVIYLPPAGAL
jgi:hypothetical protein